MSEGRADAKRGAVGATADTEAILEKSLYVRSELKAASANHYRNDPATPPATSAARAANRKLKSRKVN